MSAATDRAKAVAHPLRVRILTELANGDSSPNRLAVILDEPLGNVSYHVKTLVEYRMIELTKTEPRRGAVEHFYRVISLSDGAALDRITMICREVDAGDRDADNGILDVANVIAKTGRDV